ncbi:MAG: Transcriptional regulator [Rhodospirillales bacterium]|nr:Transcriptional regulator [Rhodospirillales bacterium]
MSEYPTISLEIAVDGARADIVAGRFDAGIRLGELVERDMVVVRLGAPVRPMIVASPGYIARRGRPNSPDELRQHSCVRIRLPGGDLLPWRFQKNGKLFEASAVGPLVVNDRELELGAALDGVAIACVLSNRVVRHLSEGRLVALLNAWTPPASSFFLYYPSRRQMPSPLRAFIDFVRARLRSETEPAAS